MNKYRVWSPDYHDAPEHGVVVDAFGPRGAAAAWAKQHDAHTAEYTIANGESATVHVCMAGSDKVEKFEVTGEAQPVYHVWPVRPLDAPAMRMCCWNSPTKRPRPMPDGSPIAHQLRFAFGPELIVDLFAGAGGASEGIRQAFGRDPDIAINHDPIAVSMHEANHPSTRHYVSDVFEVDPIAATGGRPVGLLWASPDCKHFSKAKGGKPRSKKIRSLAWVVVKWAKAVRPRVIILENVEEFVTWGPLARNGQPCPDRKGRTFDRWIAQLRGQGYRVEWKELRACDYGAPTIRKRFFLIARCDQLPLRWPAPTHGKPDSIGVRKRKLLPWRTAAECIDWSIPVPSIFERAKPLAEATLRRIAAGVQRYVLDAAEPYFVTYAQQGGANRPATAPLHTVTASTKDQNCLVAAFLAKHYTGVVGSDLRAPIGTVTSVDHHSLVNALLIKYYGNDEHGQSVSEPMHTVPTRDRFGLVAVTGQRYAITDIGMRMLQPRELFRAQGFPDTYQIDIGADGRRFTKTQQVRACGNSVCPPIARALVAANVGELVQAEAKERAA